MTKSPFKLTGRTETEVRALFAYFYKGNSDFIGSVTFEDALEKIANSRDLSEKAVIEELLALESVEFKSTSGLEFLTFKLETSGFSAQEIDLILELANLHYWRLPPKTSFRRVSWPRYPYQDIRIDFDELIHIAKTNMKLFTEKLQSTLSEIEASIEAAELLVKERIDQREKFIDYLHSNSLKEYGLSISEVVLLGLLHPKIFEIPPGGLIVDYLHKIYLRSTPEFGIKLHEAKRLRDENFKKAEKASMHDLLVLKLKYLLFEAQSEKLANQAFVLICRFGDSETWNSVRKNEIDSLEVRLFEIPKFLEEPDVFNKIIREMADSPRARIAFKEFSKRAGSPWDVALKY